MAPRSIRVRREREREREWSSLPSDVLTVISRKVGTNVFDLVRFRTVCRSWRSAGGDLSPQFPWLMLHESVPSTKDTDYFSFLIPSIGIRRLYLPEARGKQVCGSRIGWLALVHDMRLRKRKRKIRLVTSLLNPLTRTCISLPPLEIKSREHEQVVPVEGVVFSSSPAALATACTVMVWIADSTELAYCRRGADGEDWSQWIMIDTGFTSSIEDIAYHLGKLYAVDENGGLWICDIDVSKQLPEEEDRGGDNMTMTRILNYFVESSGVLLLAVLYHNISHQRLLFYRMEESGDGEPEWKWKWKWKWKWIRDQSMGLERRALFVSKVQSFSVSTCDVPGCRENTIYHGRELNTVYHGRELEPYKHNNFTLCGVAYDLKGGDNILINYHDEHGSLCSGRSYYATWVVPTLE